MSKSSKNQPLITGITTGELQNDLTIFMGSALKDETNYQPGIMVSLWDTYLELSAVAGSITGKQL